MKLLKKPLQILLAVVAAFQLTACSKTVQWEEEVPLNTGETIWVKRTDSFVSRSEPGNPLRMGWWPKARSYAFAWQGQNYTYHVDVKISSGAILLYPWTADKTIAIVDGAANCAKSG